MILQHDVVDTIPYRCNINHQNGILVITVLIVGIETFRCVQTYNKDQSLGVNLCPLSKINRRLATSKVENVPSPALKKAVLVMGFVYEPKG